jgi:NADPH-dependent curcumin reductase CurA
MPRSREIHLVARPEGEPRPEDFALVEVDVRDPGPGEVLVRNRWMSVDPYMRGRMSERRSYAEPWKLGEAAQGGAVGEVVASEAPELAVGSVVQHELGWRELTLVKARHTLPVDPSVAPEQAFLGVLGMPGLTAYVGILDIAGLRDGDVVFVSGAAGAVGSVAGQLAKLRGHTVIGSAGSEDKVAHVTQDLGFDACLNYRAGDVRKLLLAAAPDGIDVFFDNVGGDHLEAAITAFRMHARAALCGSISGYNATEPVPGPRNLSLLVGKRATLKGYIVSDHADRRPAFIEEVAGHLRAGRLHYQETVMEGLEQAPAALIGLLRGANTGKMLVRIAD